MNKKLIYILSVSLLLLIVYPTIQCHQNNLSNSEPSDDIFRLIDHLKAKNIISTPFANITDKFTLFEEKLSQKLINLPELSTSKQKVWAATTGHPILGFNENKVPYGLEILINNKKINMMEEAAANSISWKWIKTNKNIQIAGSKNYNRVLKSLVLDQGKSFSFETILPGAPVEIEIQTRRNWHPVNLEVYLNESLIKSQAVGKSWQSIKIERKNSSALNKITLEPSITKRIKKKNKSPPPRLFINKIKVKTQNDVILFFVPSKKQKEFLKSKIELKYFSYQPNREKYKKLFRMKHDFTLSKYDQKENPENIKKKITVENLAMNVLMAPPESSFSFKILIQPRSFLEFGLGIFSYEEIENHQSVKFKITAEYNKEKKTIFEKIFQIRPGSQRNQFVLKKIDLKDMAGKNIKLTLATEKIASSMSKDPTFSFWYNPIIYQSSPNKLKIILISIDTLRASHLGCYGYPRQTSPDLDELAKDGVLFENVYSQSPWTLPSHLSLLFSLNTASHQVYYSNQKIDNSLPSLSYFLRKKGFSTYAFTGGGYVSSIYGFSKGFDWYEEPVGGRYAPLFPNEAEKLFNYTSTWLKENKDKQFFLFLHTFQTHGPYDCPSPWNETFLNKKSKWKKIRLRSYLDNRDNSHPFSQDEIQNIIDLYDGEIRYTDEALLKPLIKLLKDLNIYENTLLVITSDHGEEFYDHQGWLHGTTVYNELIRIPLIIKFPHSKYKNIKIKTKCRSIDIMPTLLDWASVKNKKAKLDGRSLMDLILKKEVKDRTFISDLARKDVPIPCPALIATNSGNYKVIIEKSAEGIKKIELYNLLKDPQETDNIFRKKRKIAMELIDNINNYYRKKQKIQRKKGKVYLSDRLKEKLRALGYIH